MYFDKAFAYSKAVSTPLSFLCKVKSTSSSLDRDTSGPMVPAEEADITHVVQLKSPKAECTYLTSTFQHVGVGGDYRTRSVKFSGWEGYESNGYTFIQPDGIMFLFMY